MVKYRLHEETESKMTYYYYPEGKEDYGIITIDKINGEIKIEHFAEGDRKYAFKVYKRLEEFYRTGEYQDSGMVAWY